MPCYQYQALDLQGRTRKDQIQADNERQARQRLREQGLFVRHLREHSSHSWAARRQQLSHSQRCELTRQLSTLLGAGISLVEALSTLERQLTDAATRRLLRALSHSLAEGHGLAESLRRQGSFDALYCALVEAGEKSGKLAAVLERLAEYLEQVQRQRHKARTALIYPSLLLLVSLLVVVGLMVFVVPKLTEQFNHAGQSLPLITQVLISLSDALRQIWPLLLGLIVAVALVRHWMLGRPHWRYRHDHLLLRLPRLGLLCSVLNSARLSRSLAILTGSGVPLLEALQVSTASVTNQAIYRALQQVQTQVKTGISLHRALDQSGHFPPLLLNMVASGEASGTLPEMLGRVAEDQERGFARQVDLALALFEPVMILVMGAVVLFIVLAVLLPVMQLNQGLSF